MIYAINKQTKEHRVVSGLDAYSNHDWKYVEADADGWIEWTGGECPLPDDSWCDAETIAMNYQRVLAKTLQWGKVTRYRPILDADTKPEAPEWAIGDRCTWHLGDVCMGEHVILAKDGDTYWIRDDHGGYDMADREELRPIRTPAQQAEDAMVSVAVENNLLMSPDGAKSIYAAIRDGKIPGVKLEDEP